MEVSCVKLLKTNVEKMSVFRLAIMLLERNGIWSSCHHVYENKGEIDLPGRPEKLRGRRARSPANASCASISRSNAGRDLKVPASVNVTLLSSSLTSAPGRAESEAENVQI